MWNLAYDDSCSQCRGIARSVRDAAGGILGIVSLKDSQVQDAIRRAGLRTHRPTLLGGDGEVYQGPQLAWQMLRILGSRRAIRVLRLIGEDSRPKVTPKAAGQVSRRTLLAGASSLALGALIAGGALARPSAAQAATNDDSSFNRIHGYAETAAIAAAKNSRSVARLIKELAGAGYTVDDQMDSAAVVVSDKQGRTITVLSLWHDGAASLAVIALRSWAPSVPKLSVLQEIDGKVQSSASAPGATLMSTSAPASDNWGECIIECLISVCPVCNGICQFAGIYYYQCLLDCCAVGGGLCWAACTA